ncbi:hypothetical protein H8S51_015960 [Roseburia rectibacter]|jgi:methyl-accepting chemotaxis protein|nr:hypothetical protein [Roseburia rectibacter]UMY99785.1 hypothetical protein H8S51_015960 [Roseburia rectibacter]
MTKTGSQKNFKISIRAKILVGMIVCVLTVTNLIGWFFYSTGERYIVGTV